MTKGVGTTTGQGVLAEIILQYSDDEGHTWSNERWANLGAKGNYKDRTYWTRLGRSRDRAFRLTVSDPIDFTLLGAFIP